jgi:hypothetical protein
MQHFDTATLRETAMGEDSIEPVLCVAVFGEDNGPLLVPLAAGSKVVLKPSDELMRFGVESGGSELRPILQLVQDFPFGFGCRPESPRRRFERLLRRFRFFLVADVSLVGAFEDLLEETLAGRGGLLRFR